MAYFIKQVMILLLTFDFSPSILFVVCLGGFAQYYERWCDTVYSAPHL